MFSDILAFVKTKDDLETLETEIGEIRNALYKKEAELELVLAKRVRKEVADIFRKNLYQENLDKEDYFAKLEKEISRLKIIGLVVAFEPTEENIARIFDWISQKISRYIVLDINIDKNIIGGAVLVIGGKYKDYSVRRRLRDYFQENKAKLIEKYERF